LAPEAVIVGEQFRLSYIVNAEAKDFRLQGEMPDFDVLMGPTPSVNYSQRWVNGKSSSETSFTFTYILRAKKEGTFNIPPATVKVNNATYTSNALVVKALPQDKAEEVAAGESRTSSSGLSKDDVFIRLIVAKRDVYEQEGILVTLKLYARNYGISGLPVRSFPEFEGFLAQEIELPQEKPWVLENYNGYNYQTVVLKQSVLFPQRSGNLTIDGGKYEAVVRMPTQRKISSIFDDFAGMYRDVNISLVPPPVTVNVKPLPSGKPASFSGGVGDFTLKSSVSSTEVKANEAVTVTLKINGNGNIRLVKNPEVKYPNDFDIYDPKIAQDVKTTAAGVNGSKTIEYTAIPRFGGDFEIPPVTFSYFDPKTETYKTLSTEPYRLHVEKGEGDAASGPVVSNFSNRESVRVLGQDIRYLKVKDIDFVSKDELLYGSSVYYLCYLVPALLFIAFFFIYRKQVKENANIALVRTKKANKMAVKRLKIAGRLLKANRTEEFHEEVLRALWGYLSDKLNIPQSNLTKDNVETELTQHGVDETLIKEFMDILNTCEFARYAPSQAPDAMDKLYGLAVDAIGNMERVSFNPPKGGKKSPLRGGWVGLLLLVSSLCAQESVVKEAETAYAGEQYAEAIEKYEAVLKDYGESSQVYYNLGNAYYKAGQIAPALLNYERALLLDPGDSDIRFNLHLARQRAVDRIEPVGEFFLARWFLAVQDMGKADSWAELGIAGFLLFTGCLALFFFSRWVRLKKVGFYLGVFLLAVVIVTNIFARNQKNELLNRTSAIVFSPTVTVKSSPAASGTELFILHEGAKVSIKSTLGEWKEIELEDGNKGWIPEKDIEII
jgi:tetratricopeptide (TPR) repeat protein